MKKKIILIDKLNLITFIISLIYYKRKVVFFTKTKESQEVFFSKCLIVFRKSFKFDVVCYDKNPLYYKKILNATINMTQKNITRLNVDELIYYTCKLNLYYGLFKINEVGVFYKEKYDIEYIFINYVNILKNLDYTNSFQKKIKFYTWFNLKLNDSPESALSSKSLDKRLKDKVKWLLIFIKVAIVAKKTSFDINILYCSDRTYAHNKHNNVFKNLNEEKDAFYNFTTNKIFFKKIEYNLYTLHYKSILNYLFFMIKYYFKYRMFFNKYNTVSLYDQFFLFKNIYFFDRLIKENNIKIVFTIYEALIATIINHITSKSKKTISVSSTWSLRYFSSLEADCNKYSDINFVWGDYQKNIFLKSYDKSKNYIISGYLGDFATEHFKSESKKYVGMNYIVLYDNIFHDDFFITQQQIYEFINITVLFCKKNN